MDDAVRRARPNDAPAVTRLLAGFRDFYGNELPTDESIAAVVAKLLADPDAEYLLAGDPAFAVAQIRYRLSVWTGVEDAWLEDVFVEPEARAQGAGRALAEAVLDRARARRCRRVQLDCNERNAAALGLYGSLGFSASADRWDGGRDLYLTRWL